MRRAFLAIAQRLCTSRAKSIINQFIEHRPQQTLEVRKRRYLYLISGRELCSRLLRAFESSLCLKPYMQHVPHMEEISHIVFQTVHKCHSISRPEMHTEGMTDSWPTSSPPGGCHSACAATPQLRTIMYLRGAQEDTTQPRCRPKWYYLSSARRNHRPDTLTRDGIAPRDSGIVVSVGAANTPKRPTSFQQAGGYYSYYSKDIFRR